MLNVPSCVCGTVMKLRLLLVIAAIWTLPAFAQEVVYKIVAKDGKLEPAVIEVPAGKRFKLEVVNEGKTAIEFESKDLKQEKVVAPGAKTSLSINALKAGEYKFFDEFHEATAKGKIIAK
jgi:uncharacterized cupredoxin-like copper-binding protein